MVRRQPLRRLRLDRWNVCCTIGGYLHRNAPETPRALSTVELGVHKLSPGILTHEYCRPERTIATIRCHEQTWGLESGSRRQARQNETESRRVTALSKVEVGVPDSGPLRPSPTPERSFARGLARGPAMRYTRFEKARIIGARALQISMGSPILIDVPSGVVDPTEIARIEFNSRAIPITVRRES